uniref:CB1 cannabinoid receptor-interacting protein 1 n=1 Tax=Myotis myotis TaxID=51298 RepID=A0A7J7U4H5_MYOMY|nr:cannabinoid receptor interacting protein 1 [Myotis myotis]
MAPGISNILTTKRCVFVCVIFSFTRGRDYLFPATPADAPSRPLAGRNISIGGVVVPLELKSKEPDGDRIVYMGTYDTEGVAPTKSGERQPIQITMPFTDIGTFETVWQVKFYNYHKRDHCQWGSPFSVIEYECKPNETRSLMWVNKESFL